jgi:hypothetical protein
MEDVPEHPEQACIAYNGQCYKCNPARGSECAYSWLWTGGSFGTHNIGYYYEQVDCYDPFGEEDNTEICYEIDLSEDDLGLLRQVKNDVFTFANLNEKNMININSNSNYYDALGRNLRYHVNFHVEQPIYKKNKLNTLNMLLRTTTLNGYVEGKPKMNICIKEDKIEGVVKYLNIEGSLQIVVGNLHYQGNDNHLIAHEKKT